MGSNPLAHVSTAGQESKHVSFGAGARWVSLSFETMAAVAGGVAVKRDAGTSGFVRVFFVVARPIRSVSRGACCLRKRVILLIYINVLF